jgi:hypothetical protein
MIHEIPLDDIASTRAQRSRLDDVITACRDASMTFRAAAKFPSGHREELIAEARRRSSFAHTLSGFLPDPDAANEGGSLGGRAGRWLFKLRSILLGQNHLGDSLVTCLRVDGKAMHSYARALDIDWPGDIEDVLQKQADEIDASSGHVRDVRGHL